MDRRLPPLHRVRVGNLATLIMGSTFVYCAMIPTSVIAQQVYKWTDSSGQVHFSDHAPPEQTATTVHVPSTPPPKAASTPQPVVVDAEPANAAEINRQMAHFTEKYTPADPEVLARQREQSNAEEAAKKSRADKELVAKCMSQRDADCQVGEIKKREAILNEPPPARYRCFSAPAGVPPLCEWVLPPKTNSASTPPPAKKKSTSRYTIEDN